MKDQLIAAKAADIFELTALRREDMEPANLNKMMEHEIAQAGISRLLKKSLALRA